MSMLMVVLKSDFCQNTTYALLPGQRRNVLHVLLITDDNFIHVLLICRIEGWKTYICWGSGMHKYTLSIEEGNHSEP